MSSTEPLSDPARIDALFDETVLPAAEKLARDGRQLFPIAPDPSASSYYIRRTRTRMTPSDFEVTGCDSAEAFCAALVSLWSREDHGELVHLAPALASLADTLRRVAVPSDQVSPFIYQMF